MGGAAPGRNFHISEEGLTTRDALYWVFWRSGLAGLAYRLLVRGGRFAINLHGVSHQRISCVPEDVQPYLTADELEGILGWLKGRFSFLHPADFLETSRPGVLLTFDDGHANDYTNALPVLEKFDAPAVLFVTTQHVKNPRDWLPASRRDARRGWGDEGAVPPELAVDFFDGLSQGQLVACARHPLLTIGSHTVSHPFLSRCTSQQVQEELSESKHFLESSTGKVVDLFAYPSGDYNRQTVEAVRTAGYRAAFALDPKGVFDPTFEIPRVGIYASEPAYLSLKFSGLHRRPLPARPVLL